MNSETIENLILSLYNKRKWKDIAELSDYIDATALKFTWVIPSLSDLSWISETVKQHNLSGITSIGCGCGLLEWMLQEHSGLEVVGIELDTSWWHSKYSPPLFLDNITFVEETKTRDFCVPSKHALMFCYFNNAPAFCNYINNYEGNLIFVIGPADGQNRTTDPLPFDKKFEKYGWKLSKKREIKRSKDYITVYVKRRNGLVA